MELYQGIILGVLQGLTEFLPVSSSGHLVLGQIFFGITEFQLIFDISVHVGTLLAVIVVYYKDIEIIIKSIIDAIPKLVAPDQLLNAWQNDSNLRFAGFIVIGSIPTAMIGFVLKGFEHILFSSMVLVGCMLILTGTILWVSRHFYGTRQTENQLSFKNAVGIGIIQGLAVIPGISRSGSTISAGMFFGLPRDQAAKFSFLLSIPAIVGAEVLGIKDIIEQGLRIDPVTIYATIASFITGLIALKLLLKLVHSGKFHLFAPYCWCVGVLVLLSKIF